MRYIVVLLLIFSCTIVPVLAEISAPEEGLEDSGMTVTENQDLPPEEIADMVADPPIVEKALELPSHRSVWEAGGKAAILPGWGHIYLERYGRAWLIMGAETAILIGISNSDPARYSNASGSTQDTIYQQRETLGVLGGLIWLWNIFDAASLAIEDNRRIEEEEKKISWQYDGGVKLVYNYRWE